MIYLRTKGHRPVGKDHQRGAVKGRPRKYFFFLQEQFDAILKAIEDDKSNPNRFRDHCAVTCSYYLALRISECATLERDCFRWADDGSVRVRTLKQKKSSREKGEDGRWYPPWKELPNIEQHFVDYVQRYMKDRMQQDQQYLFVSNNQNHHISNKMLHQIFITYLQKAGLPIFYTWHAFRHTRGVYLCERFPTKIVMVQKMLRHASLQSTSVYLDLLPSGHKERQDKIEENPWPIREFN